MVLTLQLGAGQVDGGGMGSGPGADDCLNELVGCYLTLCRVVDHQRVNILTTLLCIFLTPNSTAGCLVDLCNVVAVAAIDSPAPERRVRRNVEENSLAVVGRMV